MQMRCRWIMRQSIALRFWKLLCLGPTGLCWKGNRYTEQWKCEWKYINLGLCCPIRCPMANRLKWYIVKFEEGDERIVAPTFGEIRLDIQVVRFLIRQRERSNCNHVSPKADSSIFIETKGKLFLIKLAVSNGLWWKPVDESIAYWFASLSWQNWTINSLSESLIAF